MRFAASILVASLLGSCVVVRYDARERAAQRADALGLAETERSEFVSEVEACVGPASESGHAAVAVAEGVRRDPSPEGSAGQVGVGIAASAVTTGASHKGWHAVRRRRAHSAEPSGAAVRGVPVASADVPSAVGNAVVAESKAAPATAARRSGPDRFVVKTCLDSVTTRWRERGKVRTPAAQ